MEKWCLKHGEIRQEEHLEFLLDSNANIKELEHLFISLSPFSRKFEKKAMIKARVKCINLYRSYM